jgi:hypothetical protein
MLNKAFPDCGYMALTGKTGNPRIGVSNLPAGLHGKIGDPHSERSTARTRSGALVWGEVFVATGPTRELDDEALAHEVGSIYDSQVVHRTSMASVHTEG